MATLLESVWLHAIGILEFERVHTCLWGVERQEGGGGEQPLLVIDVTTIFTITPNLGVLKIWG